MIRPDEVKIEKEKVQGVIEQPVLREVINVQKFLELANYCRWFVKYFAKIAKLFYEMMRKDMKWNWGKRQQKTIKELKKRFIMDSLNNTRLG